MANYHYDSFYIDGKWVLPKIRGAKVPPPHPPFPSSIL